MRRSLGDRIDPRLAALVALSLTIHTGIAVAAFSHDRTIETRGERLQTQYRADIYQPRERTVGIAGPLEAVIAQPASTESVQRASELETTSAAARRSSSPARGTRRAPTSSEPATASLRERSSAAGLMEVLGGDDSQNGRYERSRDLDEGAGLGASIDNLRSNGSRVGTRGGSARTARDATQEISIARDDRLRLSEAEGGGSAESVREDRIASRPTLEGIGEEGPRTLDPRRVADKIRKRYLRGIKVCHIRVLKIDPSLGGRVQLRFTIGPSGNITRSSAKGFHSIMDSCIKMQMTTWRFGAPKEDGKPSEANYSIPVILRPAR